jgi:hypothetical protein
MDIAEYLKAAARVELIKVYRQGERGLTRVGWMLNASSEEVGLQSLLESPRPNEDNHATAVTCTHGQPPKRP